MTRDQTSQRVIFDFSSQSLRCQICGGEKPMSFPWTVPDLMRAVGIFTRAHQSCLAEKKERSNG